MTESHKTAFTSDFFVITLDERQRLVRVARTEKRFGSIGQVHDAFAPALKALQSLSGPTMILLVDLRRGPMRNDPEFEDAVLPYRARLGEGFSRAAVLMRTMVGKLQEQRIARTEKHEMAVFTDEAEALAYLTKK